MNRDQMEIILDKAFTKATGVSDWRDRLRRMGVLSISAMGYERCRKLGMSISETARECGSSYVNVASYASRHGVKFVRGKR